MSGRGALLGAIAGCHCSVIAGCHCSARWLGGRVTLGGGRGGIAGCYGWVKANFGGVDVVPLQGAIVVLGGRVTTNFGGVDVVPLITQKLVFAIWGLCWYNFNKGLSMHRKYHGVLHFFTSGSQSKPATNTGIYSALTRQHAKKHNVFS